MGGIHRWPVNSPHRGPVTRKMFPFDDVIMQDCDIIVLVKSKLKRFQLWACRLFLNRLISQIPQRIRHISHSGPFCGRSMGTFRLQNGTLWALVHCGIVNLFYWVPRCRMQLTKDTNPWMHLFHIPQRSIQNRNVHISVLNGVLCDMKQVHDGIYEIGLLFL